MTQTDETAEGDAPDPNLGRVLAKQYAIDALLGHGGMGSVYRGHQLSISRPVAIKLIAGAIANNQECIRRFRREAEAMAMLHHPNTVRLFDFGVEQGELFMVMELLEGQDLSELLAARGALPVREALGILREVLQALSEAHARGIVHRDLKPANVFMSKVPGGQVFAKVMDFGIAGIEADANTKLTLAGAVLGTPAYMSPEQAQGSGVDARSDLYSLGVLLFEMITGQVPFAADSIVQLLLAQVAKPPPRLAEVRADLPHIESLQELLDTLLAKAPDERPSTATEVLVRVETLLDSLARGAVRPGQEPIASARPVRRSDGPTRATAQTVPAGAAGAVRAPGQLGLAELVASLPGAVGKFTDPKQRRRLTATLVVVALLGVIWLWPQEDASTAPDTALAAEPTLPQAKPSPVPQDQVSAPTGRRARSAEPVLPTASARQPDLAPRSEAAAAAEPEPPAAESEAALGSSTLPEEAEKTGARPFPRIQRTLDRIFGGSGGSAVGQSQSERRYALLEHGPAHDNVVAAKRAYRAGALSEQAYEDTIWVLKTRRARRIEAEKNNLRGGTITRDEYKRRVTRIDREYEGS